MSSIVIAGAQWGDEGKGKITDFLSQKADFVVRYAGATTLAIHWSSMVRNSTCS